MIVSTVDLKKHLNVDHNEDDAYIAELEAVAEASIQTYLQRPLYEYTERCPESNTLVTCPSIRHAIRLLVGMWYANREPVAFASATELPFTVNALLIPLKNFNHHSEFEEV